MNLRLPNITAQDPSGQLRQLKSYLYQLIPELNWALKTLETSPSLPQAQPGSAPEASGPAETFASIKALIIQSADIVSAYTQRISQQLEGSYVAQSAFGAYCEQTQARLQATASQIQQSFTNLQTLTTGLEELQRTVIGVNAYINAGLLYHDPSGIPVYGIEVGQRTEVDGAEVFRKFARFSPSRLSFFDANGNEVAYISDYKLSITNVEVTGSWQMGKLEETVQPDGSVVTKYLS